MRNFVAARIPAMFEVIVRDARDAGKAEPESSSGLVFSEDDAREALHEIITDAAAATGQFNPTPILSWRILRNGIIIDSSVNHTTEKDGIR
jgi:hypothetical protein